MNKKLLNYIKQGQYIKFYQSPEWRAKRKEIMRRDNDECQHCKRQGKYSRGECVHHIKHLKDYPLLGLDNDNLVTLCNACHNIEHPEKLRSEETSGFMNEERW